MSQIKCPWCGQGINTVVTQPIYVLGMRLVNDRLVALACPRCSTVIDTMPTAGEVPNRVLVRGGLLDTEPG